MPGGRDDTQQKRRGQCPVHVRCSIRVCSLWFWSDDNDKRLRSGPVPSACFLPCEMGWMLKIQEGIRRLRSGVKTFGKSGGREHQNSLYFDALIAIFLWVWSYFKIKLNKAVSWVPADMMNVQLGPSRTAPLLRFPPRAQTVSGGAGKPGGSQIKKTTEALSPRAGASQVHSQYKLNSHYITTHLLVLKPILHVSKINRC